MIRRYKFQIDFIKRANGNCPSKEFYDELENKVKAKFIAIGKGINKSSDGILRDTERLKKLKGKHTNLWEMKVHFNGTWYRMLCFREHSDWKVTHGFIKKGNKTSREEIDKGNAIQKEYYDMTKRTIQN